MIQNISKGTFVTEKMHLNISAGKSLQISVMYVKDLKQYTDSIAMNLDLQGKLISMAISVRWRQRGKGHEISF